MEFKTASLATLYRTENDNFQELISLLDVKQQQLKVYFNYNIHLYVLSSCPHIIIIKLYTQSSSLLYIINQGNLIRSYLPAQFQLRSFIYLAYLI
ncbi:hypothetical protein FGO68_gene12432 [Halteria grandinella]|uniref:Uncharacterized protein n=1 Tax=Halteria grandinella TaxID=5974 RepID=A0A8J8P0F3_HALGN|nr:hypothetical protein FGO68_gene12432 [Halteria grandinella]